MIPLGGPYICRGCGVHHLASNPCELVLHHEPSELARCSRYPQRDHSGCPSSVECFHATTLTDAELEATDVAQLLDNVELYVHDIRAALTDEHEGHVREVVRQLAQATDELLGVVLSW